MPWAWCLLAVAVRVGFAILNLQLWCALAALRATLSSESSLSHGHPCTLWWCLHSDMTFASNCHDPLHENHAYRQTGNPQILGMGLESFTTGTDPWTTRKKPVLKMDKGTLTHIRFQFSISPGVIDISLFPVVCLDH